MRSPVKSVAGAATGWWRSSGERATRPARVLARDLVSEVRQDRVTGLAAEVAFFLVLSLFPALLLVASAVGFLGSVFGEDVARRASMNVIEVLRRVLTDDAGETVDAVRRLFVERDASLLTLSAVGGVWATARGFDAVIRALDVAYDIPERRSWVARRGIAVVLSVGTVGVATVMLAMLVIGPLLGAGGTIADLLGLGDVFATAWDWARVPFVALVLLLWATTVLHVAPNHSSPWRSDLPGGVLTATWWLAASLGFRYGLALSSGANQVFGVLGGALVLLVWIYVLALGLLLGGELNAILLRRREAGGDGPEGAPAAGD